MDPERGAALRSMAHRASPFTDHGFASTVALEALIAHGEGSLETAAEVGPVRLVDQAHAEGEDLLPQPEESIVDTQLAASFVPAARGPESARQQVARPGVLR